MDCSACSFWSLFRQVRNFKFTVEWSYYSLHHYCYCFSLANACAVFICKIFAFIFVKSLKHFGFYFTHISGFCSAYFLLCSCFRIESEMCFFFIYDFKMEEKKYFQCIRFFSTCYDAVKLWCLKRRLPTCFSGKNWNGRSMQKNAKGWSLPALAW